MRVTDLGNCAIGNDIKFIIDYGKNMYIQFTSEIAKPELQSGKVVLLKWNEWVKFVPGITASKSYIVWKCETLK